MTRRRRYRNRVQGRVNALREAMVVQPEDGGEVIVTALSDLESLAGVLRKARSDVESVHAVCQVMHFSPAAAMAVLDQLDVLRRRIGVERPVQDPAPVRRRRL